MAQIVKPDATGIEGLAALSGVDAARCAEFVSMGWISPVEGTQDGFDAASADRMARADGICREFSVPAIAGAIIIDLMDKVEALEERIAQLEGAARD